MSEEEVHLPEVEMIDIDLIDKNDKNPNEMGAGEFNLLVDNIHRLGFIEPCQVIPTDEGRYTLFGGHHRFEAMKLCEAEAIPCYVIYDMSEEEAEMYMVRMNNIRGKISYDKLRKLYAEHSKNHSDEILQDMYGFSEVEEFQKIVKKAGNNLPEHLKEKFKEASKELKTIDDLSNLLNRLFAEHGDTLPYGYMFIDYGGKNSIWVRVDRKTYKDVKKVSEMCMARKRGFDQLLKGLMRRIEAEKLEDLVDEILDNAPEVEDGSVAEAPLDQELE